MISRDVAPNPDARGARHEAQALDRFQEITGSELDMAEDTFKLQNVTECILKHYEDIQCAAGAVKEEQVEMKLKQVDGDWEDLIFVFNEFKQHGGFAGHGGHRHREARGHLHGAGRYGHQPILRAVQGRFRTGSPRWPRSGDHQHVAQRPDMWMYMEGLQRR